MVHVYNLLHKSRISFILSILYIKKHHHMSGQHPVNLFTNPGIFFVTVSVVYEYRIEAGQFSAKNTRTAQKHSNKLFNCIFLYFKAW